jgi:hypothetical protein
MYDVLWVGKLLRVSTYGTRIEGSWPKDNQIIQSS